MVSVITPTYNRKSELRRCIDSVAAQDYPNLEHIIVDDGSTDGTWDGLRPLYREQQESGSIVWLRQANAGPGAARNRGICRARGEFIAYLDSDDEFLPGHVSALIAPMLEDPGIGAAFARSIELVLSEDGRIVQTRINQASQRCVMELRYKNCIPVNILHRRAAVNIIGLFDAQLDGLEDWDFLVRLSEAAPLRFVDQVTAKLNVTPSKLRVTSRVGQEQYIRVRDRMLRRETEMDGIRPAVRDLIAVTDEMLFDPVAAACRTRAPGPADVPQLNIDVLMHNHGKDICRILHGFYKNYSGAFNLRFADAESRDGTVYLFEKLKRIFLSKGLEAPAFVSAAGPDLPARARQDAGWSGWIHPSAADNLGLIRRIAAAVDGIIGLEESLAALAAHWGGASGYLGGQPRRLPMMIRTGGGFAGGSPWTDLLAGLTQNPSRISLFGPASSGMPWPVPTHWRQDVEHAIAAAPAGLMYQNNLRSLLDADLWLAALGAAASHLPAYPAVHSSGASHNCMTASDGAPDKLYYHQLEPDLAARLADLPNDPEEIVLFGLGLGYELNAILKARPGSRVRVFERDIRMWRTALEHADLRASLDANRVRLFIGPDSWDACLAGASTRAAVMYLDCVEPRYSQWIDAFYASRAGRPDRAA